MATTGSIFDTEANRIEEVLSKQIDTMLPTMDPAWRDTVITSQGVGSPSEFSKDLQVNKLFRGGVTGVIDGGGPAGDWSIYGTAGSTLGKKLRLDGTAAAFPDALQGAKQATYKMTVPMKALHTNLALSLAEMQMDATPAVVDQVIAPTLQGFAQNLSHTLCNYWYVSQNDSYMLDSVVSRTTPAETAASGSASAQVVTTVTLTGKLTDRFNVGQRVDVVATDSIDRRNSNGNGEENARINCWVNAVDDIKGTVELISDDIATYDGDANWMIDIIAGDKIVLANSGLPQAGAATSAYSGIAGINSWLKGGDGNGSTVNNDNTLLGTESITGAAINVNDHPEFKSFFKSGVGSLTEGKLRKYIRRFHAAKGKYGMSMDCLIASDGVWLDYEAQKVGQYIVDRTNGLSSLNPQGSEDGFNFYFEGRNYKGYTSNYVDAGVVYGIKKAGNNWKRYVAPDYSGLTSMGEAPSHVPFRFVMPALTGTNSAKFPLLASGAVTEQVQMPGMLRMQLIPDQAAGMKLSGCSTDVEYGD